MTLLVYTLTSSDLSYYIRYLGDSANDLTDLVHSSTHLLGHMHEQNYNHIDNVAVTFNYGPYTMFALVRFIARKAKWSAQRDLLSPRCPRKAIMLASAWLFSVFSIIEYPCRTWRPIKAVCNGLVIKIPGAHMLSSSFVKLDRIREKSGMNTFRPDLCQPHDCHVYWLDHTPGLRTGRAWTYKTLQMNICKFYLPRTCHIRPHLRASKVFDSPRNHTIPRGVVCCRSGLYHPLCLTNGLFTVWLRFLSP